MRQLPALLALAALVVAAPALAQEMNHREGVIAEHAANAFERPLELDLATLERDHPTIARALGQPGAFTPALDEAEEAQLRTFWEQMADHDGLRVDGQDWQLSPAMPGSVISYGDGAADSGLQSKGDAPAPAALGVAAAVGLAVVAAARRR